MRVRVIYFGVLRELLRGDREFVEVAEGAIVADVLNVYRERVPGFAWDSIAVAVNQEYAQRSDGLRDGDEVALLPPVSGGVECLRGLGSGQKCIPQGLKPESRLRMRRPRLKPWRT